MSSRLSRFTQYFESGGEEQKRYHSRNEIQMPDEVSDPHTWKDETRRRRMEWLQQNKRLFVTLVFFGGIFTVVLFIWVSRFFPQVYSNPYVRSAVWYGSIIGGSFYFGLRTHKSRMREQDWLVLVYDDGVKRYHGWFEPADEDDAPAFIPIKGYSWMGLRAHPLTLGDLSNEMARQFAKSDRKADDPARIRLHKSMAAVAPTEMGTVVAQLTDGLEPDEFGRRTDIEATVPALAKEEQMHKLKKELQEQVAENAYLKDRISMLKDQRDDYKEMATERENDVQRRFVNIVTRVVNATQGGGGGMGGGFGGGMGGPMDDGLGPEPDYGAMDEEVEEELNDDF